MREVMENELKEEEGRINDVVAAILCDFNELDDTILYQKFKLIQLILHMTDSKFEIFKNYEHNHL